MKSLLVFSCVAALALSLNACNRNSVDPTSADASARTSSVTSTTAGGPKSLTTVDVSSLPAAITTYITTNYAGATIKEARKDPAGNYLVAISANNTITLLVFKADGTFDKVIDGKGKPGPGDTTHHPKHAPGDSTNHPKPAPGDTTHRPHPAAGDTLHHTGPGKGPGIGAGVTEVDAASLPAAITAYINTNYAGATIEKAVQEKTTNDYVVLIKTTDGKHVLLLFGSDGTFKKAVTGK